MIPLDYESPTTKKRPRFQLGTVSLALASMAVGFTLAIGIAIHLRPFVHNSALTLPADMCITALAVGLIGRILQGRSAVTTAGIIVSILDLMLIPSLIVA